MSQAETQDKYILYLCHPKRTIKKILVHKRATIKDLGKLFPNENKSFIFNGKLLSDSVPLELYGISDLDHIVVLPKDNMHGNFTEAIAWLNATRDQTEFNDRIKLSVSISTRSEVARLKDIKFSKLELKRKTFSKIVNSMANEAPNSSKRYQHKTTTSDSINAPSCDPLPIFWNLNKRRSSFKILREGSDPEI